MEKYDLYGVHNTESFIKAAQYIVRLTAEQNALEELGKIIVNYFHASWVAFAGMGTDKKIFLHDCAMLDKDLHGMVLMEKTTEHIHDVFGSGFLASAAVVLSEPYEATFLPLTELNQTKAVMIVAHKPHEPVSAERLNLYLALAGIAGSTMGRISTEQELRRHQRHLEDLVEERTRSLRASNEKLEQEIVERDRAQRALRESEQRWATTLSSIGDAVIATDDAGRITFMNAVAEELTGWTLDEASGARSTKIFNIIDEQTRREIESPVDRALREGMIVGLANHTLLVRKDGSEVPIDDSGAPITDAGGRTTGVVLVFRDIAERRRAEKALGIARDELEQRVLERTAELQRAYDKLMQQTRERERVEAQLRQAQKMEALGTLTGGIAHDFNNMLAAIIGFTEMAQDGIPSGSRVQRQLSRVLEAGLRGRDLVKQLLTFSRQTEQEKKPLSLSSIVKETAKLIRASIPTTISIRVNAKSESGFILADPVQIQQVVMNLCTNSAHAMREKGGILDAEVCDFSVSPHGGNPHGIKPGLYVKLTVRDTGTGISPDIIGKIFDPFFTTKNHGEGTGLGLSVVDGIVTQHDGYITVESEPGKGSAFTVYLPRVAEIALVKSASEEAIPAGHERVLFVDDEEVLAEMGQELLEELGYRVTTRTSSIDALATLKADPAAYDFIITDQTMPEMTGVELAKEVLALRPDMPVILCTGFSHLVDADQAKAAGVREFAMKPLTRAEIAKTIRKVLDE
jgi:PAS domain S-box-containing protein